MTNRNLSTATQSNQRSTEKTELEINPFMKRLPQMKIALLKLAKIEREQLSKTCH